MDFQINNCCKGIYSSCKKRTSLLAKNNKKSLLIYLQYRKTIPTPPSLFSPLLGPRLPPTSDHRFPKKENRERERSCFALRFIQSTPCSQNCLHLNTGREIADNSDFITLSRNWNLMIVHVRSPSNLMGSCPCKLLSQFSKNCFDGSNVSVYVAMGWSVFLVNILEC